MIPTACTGRRDEPGHAQVCAACRLDARIAAAWKALRVHEPAVAVPDRFVERVVRAVEQGRAVRARYRWIAAAAAAALFSFCAGLAHGNASRETAPSTPEDSYAALAAPNALEGLVPN
jgi:hypothetical protein